jgi:hypothetical protein
MPGSIVVTTVNQPNGAMRAIAGGAVEGQMKLIVIGDSKSPPRFDLDGCEFYGVGRQLDSGLRLARGCPLRHYARKNIGYLLAMRERAAFIRETDDDNIPHDDFFDEPTRLVHAASISGKGWLNAYRYFTDANVWPRGFLLDRVQDEVAQFDTLDHVKADCPIQQGLADDNPDVDAIYRLTHRLPLRFRQDRRIAIGGRTWCPFNSQNTTWWPDAYPLLYLPAYCSFRMTDIWRSFVAQRIAWENGWSILFHGPTVRQERNEHDLMRDFADEISGYLHNGKICRALEDLPLVGGVDNMTEDLRRCYGRLTELEVVGPDELTLLDAWVADIDEIRGGAIA